MKKDVPAKSLHLAGLGFLQAGSFYSSIDDTVCVIQYGVVSIDEEVVDTIEFDIVPFHIYDRKYGSPEPVSIRRNAEGLFLTFNETTYTIVGSDDTQMILKRDRHVHFITWAPVGIVNP